MFYLKTHVNQLSKFHGYHDLGECEVLSETSWTVTFVTASVKEDESGDQGHPQAYCISLPCDTALLYTSASSNSHLIWSVMDGKSEQRFCVKFCVKLDKSAAATIEMLSEAF
jgi:hypothetical protein